MRGAIPQFPKYASMAWCLVKVQRQLYLYPYLYQEGLLHEAGQPAGKLKQSDRIIRFIEPVVSIREYVLEYLLPSA